MFSKTMCAKDRDKGVREAFAVKRQTGEFLEDSYSILRLADIDPGQTLRSKDPPTLRCNKCLMVFTHSLWLADIIALESDPRYDIDEKLSRIEHDWSLLDW